MMKKKKRVGVIGLGLMGSGIASRLVSAGYDVSVYNRTKEKAGRFSKVAAVASSPKELASECDVVVTCVTDFDALRQVLFDEQDGIAESAPAAAVAASGSAGRGEKEKKRSRDLPIVVDSSTISPAQSEFCAQALRRKGIEMLGAPVMGGPAAAEAGELVPIVAGSRRAYEQARKVIETMGRRIFYVGPKDGAANAVKLALNLNIALIASALAEGITLARGCGLDPSIFVQVLNSTYFKTGLSEKKGPKMVEGDFEPSFHLRNMLKDLELAGDTAQAAKISLPQAALAEQVFRAASNSGFSEQDYTAVCAFLARINGLEDRYSDTGGSSDGSKATGKKEQAARVRERRRGIGRGIGASARGSRGK